MKLDPKTSPWLQSEAVRQILDVLPEGSTRFVGGCVRNALMGEPIGDIDMATQLKPEEVQAIMEAAGIRTVPTGIAHGTLTVVIDHHPYEITTLRKDVETDGRRAVIAYTDNWAEDAQRRDFTVNALYADGDGKVFDPTGEGIVDLSVRKFRFVGDADMRVREDYLRILRYFRFLAQYCGDGKIDAEALRACRENRAGLKSLSAERVWSELKKILSAADPVRAVRIMQTNEVLETVLPEASNSEGLDLTVQLEQSENMAPNYLCRLMAMSARDELGITRLSKRLKMSKTERERLTGWSGSMAALSTDMDEPSIRKAVYEDGKAAISDRAIVRAAGTADPVLRRRWIKIAEFARNWEKPNFPIRGRDLRRAGIAEGPQMGKTLKALEALWIRSDFQADHKRLMTALSLISGQISRD